MLGAHSRMSTTFLRRSVASSSSAASRKTSRIISSTSTTTSSSRGFFSGLFQARIPKGFENFFPKNNGGAKPPKKSPSSSSSTAKESASESAGKASAEKSTAEKIASIKGGKKAGKSNNKKKKGSKKPFPDGSDQYSGLFLIPTLAGLYYLLSDSNGASGDGREISWSEFRNTLLESGQVERIIVTNKSTAKVVMKPSYRPSSSNLSSTSRGNSGQGPSSQKKDDNGWDATVIDMSSEDEDLSNGADGGKKSDHVLQSILTAADNQRGGNSQSSQQASYFFHIGSVDSFERKLETCQNELNISPKDMVPVQYVSEASIMSEAMKFAPSILTLGVLFFMLRGAAGGGAGGGMGNVFKIGKSNAKKVKKEEVSVTFKDVAGCQEAKKEIMEFVDFLQDAERFTKLGAKIPKGALLCGPPGTGKTLLAKAVAGEADVPFFSISGSDFIEMFVGVGPSRVRDLFKEARASAPSIIFIDEIDAVGRARGKGGFSGGNDERENTLNQLLVEMDGFSESTGVVVLAGTNRADVLDQALLRPGRFDRQITVDKPDIEGRKEIFEVHLKGIKLDGEIPEFSSKLAGLTPGMAGADIANMCNEAAIQAARRRGESVSFNDFEKASDRVIGGLESNKIISVEEKKIVAYHEAGHAVAGWFLEHADPLLKVTIVPRGNGALGFAQYLPKEVFLRTQEQIMDIICMALAGRAAEEIMFGKFTTGASDDLRRVTGLVYQMIQVYGMNDTIGQLSFPKDDNNPYAGNPYSDATAQAMDKEAKLLVDKAYQRTLDLLTERKEQVILVAELLIEKETINHDDVVEQIGDRPFEGDKSYKEYVSNRYKANEDEEANKGTGSSDGGEDEGEENIGNLTPAL